MNGTAGGDDDREGSEPAVEDADALEGRIEPGQPSAENVAFVLLGVLGALYVVAQIAGLV